MKTVFIDSGFLIALISENDSYHSKALAQSQVMNRELKLKQSRFLTTRAVLLELGARLSKPLYRLAAAQVISSFENSSDIEIIEISKELFLNGLTLFSERKDKKSSLCDCISFVVMKERGIQEALVVDADFEQAGFSILRK
ncbi:MAG: PIN domain-containing protein [Chloroherpetonaceae bacterium]|nr:PIN domain-containing protein [Chloroherpetonaceae bacterium]